MSDLFHLGHVAQLHEIQSTRKARGEAGLGEIIEALIARLTNGGVAGKYSYPLWNQAKRYWDLGVGQELGYKDTEFEKYLATIPEIPEQLQKDDAAFPHLILVEPRIGLKKLCVCGNVEFNGDDQTFEVFDKRHTEFTQPTWIRIQDGRRNRNRKVRDCRKSFGMNERGLSALQGVCAYLQHGEVVSDLNKEGGHAMDLSGSVHRDNRDHAAYLDVVGGQAVLDWSWDANANPRYGSASRRECEPSAI